MDFEKYTDRAKGFIQNAQTLALKSGHQQLTPLHVLKVILEDKEGLGSDLIDAAGGQASFAWAKRSNFRGSKVADITLATGWPKRPSHPWSRFFRRRLFRQMKTSICFPA